MHADSARARRDPLCRGERERETLFSGNVSICGGIKFVARPTSWVAAVTLHPCWVEGTSEGGCSKTGTAGEMKRNRMRMS